MPKIRTTFRPDLEIDVDEHEEGVLRAAGRVVDEHDDAIGGNSDGQQPGGNDDSQEG